MLINKIPASSSVELHCTVTGKPPLVFNVESVVGSIGNDKCPLLYCTPVQINGKLASLKSCSVSAYILNRGDHRRYHFAIESATHVKNPRTDGSLLLLSCRDDSKPLNYRRAPRVPCVCECQVHFGGTVTPIDGQLRDISTCGVGFVIPKHLAPVKGNTVTIAFTLPEFSMSYKVQAVVARLQEVSTNEILVGCDLTDYYPNLVALCNHLRLSVRK